MKRKLIALCVSSVLVGSGIIFNMNQDVSVPTVEKFTEDTSANVSKHKNVGKNEESSEVTQPKKSESEKLENKGKSTEKNESQVSKHLQVKVRLQPVFLRKAKNKIPKKKVLVRVLPVQIKNIQLQTVPIHQINRTMML